MSINRPPELIKARWEKRRRAMAKAFSLRAQGKTLSEIGAEIGYSTTAVWMMLNLRPREQRKAAS